MFKRKDHLIHFLKSSKNKIRRRIMPVTAGLLITLNTLSPSISHAVSKDTFNLFKVRLGQVGEIIRNSANTVISEDGTVTYNLSDEEKQNVNKLMDAVVKEIENDVKNEIKSQDWQMAEHHLHLLSQIVEAYGLIDYANELKELSIKVHEDFRSRIDFNKDGIYTLNGKIYAIVNQDKRNAHKGIRNGPQRKVQGMLQVFISENYTKGRNFIFLNFKSSLRTSHGTAILFEIQGDFIVEQDGEKERISSKDLAVKLKQQKRFLPLK